MTQRPAVGSDRRASTSICSTASRDAAPRAAEEADAKLHEASHAIPRLVRFVTDAGVIDGAGYAPARRCPNQDDGESDALQRGTDRGEPLGGAHRHATTPKARPRGHQR